MSIYLRNDTYHYDFIVGGERYRGSTGITVDAKDAKKKAREKEAERKVQVREGHSVEMIWEQTKRKMIASKEVELSLEPIWNIFKSKSMSEAGKERLQIYHKHFYLFFSWMSEKHPEIRTASKFMEQHAKEYITYLRDQAGASETKNDKLRSMKMLFSVLGKDAGVIENPFAGIKKLTVERETREAFTPEELKLIGQHSTGWIRSLCLTAVSTGLREGDICLLKRTSVDLASGWITIPRIQKTGRPLEIPIMQGLRNHIQESLKDNESEYLYPELADKYINDRQNLGKRIKEFFDQIGITNTLKHNNNYIRKVSAKDIHSFRHTFVYLAALNNIPFPIVQSIVGHASPAMTKMYMDHAGREAKAKYFGQLPEYLAGSISKKRELTTSRIKRMIQKLTPVNLEKNKKRILKLLS